ncbi:MAG: flavodoxin family protein [bacterium]
MNARIIYGTNSGCTEEACEIVRDELTRHGWNVVLQRASATDPKDLGADDLTILASSTWEHILPDGKRLESVLQKEWFDLKQQLSAAKTPGKKFAVIGVGDHRYTHFAAAADHLSGIIHRMQGVLVGPPLRLDQFGFHLKESRQQVRNWAASLVDGEERSAA